MNFGIYHPLNELVSPKKTSHALVNVFTYAGFKLVYIWKVIQLIDKQKNELLILNLNDWNIQCLNV